MPVRIALYALADSVALTSQLNGVGAAGANRPGTGRFGRLNSGFATALGANCEPACGALRRHPGFGQWSHRLQDARRGYPDDGLGSFAEFGLELECAAVQLDKTANDRQTKSGPALS